MEGGGGEAAGAEEGEEGGEGFIEEYGIMAVGCNPVDCLSTGSRRGSALDKSYILIYTHMNHMSNDTLKLEY